MVELIQGYAQEIVSRNYAVFIYALAWWVTQLVAYMISKFISDRR